VAERIESIKNPSVSIENRTRDLPVCSDVSEPTKPQCTPDLTSMLYRFSNCQGRQINNALSLTTTSAFKSLHSLVTSHLSLAQEQCINSKAEKQFFFS